MIPKSLFGLRVSARSIELMATLAAALALIVFLPHNTASALGLGAVFAVGAIRDVNTRLSAAQALTATAYSTYSYNTGIASSSVERGTPMALVFTVGVAAKTSDSNETYQFHAIQSANADLSSEDILAETVVAYITKTKLVAGYQFALPIPVGIVTKKYLGAKYTLGGTNPTVTITADLVPLSDVQSDMIHASGFTITS